MTTLLRALARGRPWRLRPPRGALRAVAGGAALVGGFRGLLGAEDVTEGRAAAAAGQGLDPAAAPAAAAPGGLGGKSLDDADGADLEPPVSERLYIPPSSDSQFVIFTCSGSVTLSTEVAMLLGTSLGRSTVKQFADGETAIEVHDNVRGKDVYVVQSTAHPPNTHLMELFLFVSALKRASARRVVAVIPYFSYMRQLTPGRRGRGVTGSIAGADMAKLLEAVGCDHVITVDLHAGQTEGFFSTKVPVENVDPISVAVPYFLARNLKDPVVVSPSASGVVRARNVARLLREHGLDSSVGMLYVRENVAADDEHHHTLGSGEHMELIGDVRGQDVIVVDDMIDSGTRLSTAANVLSDAGARRVIGFATHGLLTGKAVDLINRSAADEVVVFNTIPLPLEKQSSKLRQISVSALLAEVIRRVHNETSISELFREPVAPGKRQRAPANAAQ